MFERLIRDIVKDFDTVLGEHFEKYLNHALRIYNLSVHLIQPTDEECYILAVAAAYHDLGIWTHQTLDYLSPSEELAQVYLLKNGKPEFIPMVKTCIDLHHKLRPIAENHLAEAFRKADLIDLSLGVVRFGVSGKEWKRINQAYPKKGFHRFIGSRILIHILGHPLNPLPILKW